MTVEPATVLPDCTSVSLALSGLCFGSSRLPVALRLSLTVSLVPAATVTVTAPTTTVFFVLWADAATAVSFPRFSVSSTDSLSVSLHDPLPEQLTETLAVVPDTLTGPTDALPRPGGGGLVEVAAVIEPDWPLLV